MNIAQKIGILEKRLPDLLSFLEKCGLCPRKCGVNRSMGEKGYCRSSDKITVYTYGPHHGEEPSISRSGGSGTIFFSDCNMRCVYCQNFKFSQGGAGEIISVKDLADIMMELKNKGCHNVNLVNPTHLIPQITSALLIAFKMGFDLPVIYNTGGYDDIESIKLLEDIVDIYLADMRYSSDEMALKYSSAPEYSENNRLIIKEMHKQTGNFNSTDREAVKGLIIRLLILPNNISGTVDSLEFVHEHLGKDACISVMSQYYPAYRAEELPELTYSIDPEEYYTVIRKVEELGLGNGWVQPYEGGFDKSFAGENF